MTNAERGETKRALLEFQKAEVTEHFIYKGLSAIEGGKNKEVLERISQDELRHYNTWKEYTRAEPQPDRLKISLYTLIARLLGVTFAIKLMEKGEERAQAAYANTLGDLPEAKAVIAEENQHEKELIDMIDEEKLNYTGSMVLGLSDALVELTGTVAGLTFALQNTSMVGLAALVTGIAASLSMASSEYLSQKSEAGSKSPLKASLYTGAAYIVTVILLVSPYFVVSDFRISLALSLSAAILIIVLFAFFVSVTKDQPFRRRFAEMMGITFGVAAISFVIGLALRALLGVEA